MKLYVACGLTHVPRELFSEYAARIHALAHALKGRGHDVYYALVNSDPQLADKPFHERAKLCYLWDREMIENSEAVIAEASFPSTGMGIELQIAENQGIPIVIWFRNEDSNRAQPVQYENPDHGVHSLQIGEGFVSLMALGIPAVFRVISYEDNETGIDRILEAVDVLRKDTG